MTEFPETHKFRATKILGYIKLIEQRKLPVSALFENTGIDNGRVQDSDYLISSQQYLALARNMIRLSGDSAIALDAGALAALDEFGVVGYAMLTAPTLRDATSVWVEYANTLVGPAMPGLHIRDAGSGYQVLDDNSPPNKELYSFQFEEMLVQSVKITQALTGHKLVYGSLSLAYPKPPHYRRYQALFNCPIEFDCKTSVATVLEPPLDTPVITNNQEVFEACVQQCKKVLARSSETALIVKQLRDIFAETPSALPGIDEVGERLSMSASTLRRRLDELGLSYQSVKDQFRHDLAEDYLRSGQLSSKQIAYLLGYSTPSAFTRAFKSWTSLTPGEFLQKLDGSA